MTIFCWFFPSHNICCTCPVNTSNMTCHLLEILMLTLYRTVRNQDSNNRFRWMNSFVVSAAPTEIGFSVTRKSFNIPSFVWVGLNRPRERPILFQHVPRENWSSRSSSTSNETLKWFLPMLMDPITHSLPFSISSSFSERNLSSISHFPFSKIVL